MFVRVLTVCPAKAARQAKSGKPWTNWRGLPTEKSKTSERARKRLTTPANCIRHHVQERVKIGEIIAKTSHENEIPQIYVLSISQVTRSPNILRQWASRLRKGRANKSFTIKRVANVICEKVLKRFRTEAAPPRNIMKTCPGDVVQCELREVIGSTARNASRGCMCIREGNFLSISIPGRSRVGELDLHKGNSLSVLRQWWGIRSPRQLDS